MTSIVWSVLAALGCASPDAQVPVPAPPPTTSAPTSEPGQAAPDGGSIARGWAASYAVFAADSDDPRALAGVAARVGAVPGLQATIVGSAWLADLPPCRSWVAVGAPSPDPAGAHAVVDALRAAGLAGEIRFTGAFVDAPDACPPLPTGGELGVWVADGAGGLGLGPYAGPAPGPDAEIAGLRVGDRLRVGGVVCTVDGFDVRSVCADQPEVGEVHARLDPGCAHVAGLAVPPSAPEPEPYLAGAVAPALDPAALDVLVDGGAAQVVAALTRANGGPATRVERAFAAWTGSGGTVVAARQDHEWDGAELRSARVISAWLLGVDGRRTQALAAAVRDGVDVAAVFDLDLDGTPEIQLAGPDGDVVWTVDRPIAHAGRARCAAAARPPVPPE